MQYQGSVLLIEEKLLLTKFAFLHFFFFFISALHCQIMNLRDAH